MFVNETLRILLLTLFFKYTVSDDDTNSAFYCAFVIDQGPLVQDVICSSLLCCISYWVCLNETLGMLLLILS